MGGPGTRRHVTEREGPDQSTLRPPKVHIRTIHFEYQRAVCMGPMGVNDIIMHAVHVGAKIVHVYVQLYLLD